MKPSGLCHEALYQPACGTLSAQHGPCGRGETLTLNPSTQIVKKGDPDTGAAGARRRRNALSDLRREVAIMRTLRHRNIVTLQARTLTPIPYFDLRREVP